MTKLERIAWLMDAKKKDIKKYDGRVALLGCIICKRPANVHHCVGHNFPAKREYRPRIPLCKTHHQGAGGFHDGRETFEKLYGGQESLLRTTEMLLEAYYK